MVLDDFPFPRMIADTERKIGYEREEEQEQNNGNSVEVEELEDADERAEHKDDEREVQYTERECEARVRVPNTDGAYLAFIKNAVHSLNDGVGIGIVERTDSPCEREKKEWVEKNVYREREIMNASENEKFVRYFDGYGDGHFRQEKVNDSSDTA